MRIGRTPRLLSSSPRRLLLILALAFPAVSFAETPPPARRAIAFRTSEAAARPRSFGVVCADLNGDDAPDLAVTHAALDSVSVCLGNGDGTFAPCLEVNDVGNNPRGLAAADFNRDGTLDLVLSATQSKAVRVLYGLGGGRFAPVRNIGYAGHPFLLTAADLNRDGIADVAVAQEDSGVGVLLADGRGGFKSTNYRTGKWSSDVAAADFNSDGSLDLAVTNWGSNDVSLLFGHGDGTFDPAHNITYEGNFWDHHAIYRVLAADLDRDGAADMVWNDIIKQSLYIVYGDGKGAFPRWALVPAGRGVRYADTADLDGDGWLDLVSANTADDDVTILLGTGDGGFTVAQKVPVGRRPRMAVTCDVNRDRRPDVVVTNLKAGGITVLINTGITDAASVQQPPPKREIGTALNGPTGIVVDAGGQLVVADEANHRVVRIDPATGSVSTIAGTGYKGSGGDGGPAIDAQLHTPSGLAIDAAGSLYIADSGNGRVRKIDAQGVITTIAGMAREAGRGDGASAQQTQLQQPTSVAVDRRNAVFIADSGNNRVRKVDPNGTIATVVGTGSEGFSGDGGPGTEATVRGVAGLALDAAGALLITDRANLRIRKLGNDGKITTIAGNGTLGAGGDGGPATQAQLGYPSAVAVGNDGAVYIADSVSGSIRAVRPDGIIRTLAAATAGTVPWEPTGLALDQGGNIFFADRKHNCVRRVDASGRVTIVVGADIKAAPVHEADVAAEPLALSSVQQVTPPITMAWEYVFRSGSDDNNIYGVVAAPDGNVYVAGDISSGADWRIQQLDAAGKGGWHFDFDAGNIDVPLALTRTPDGRLVAGGMSFSSEENGRDNTIIALGSDGRERWRYADAQPGEQACHGLAADAAGNVYAAGESAERWDVLSLDAQGTLRWRYDDATSGRASAISVNGAGEIFVAGAEPQAWRVIKLNPDHTLAWQHRITGNAEARGIQATRDGGAVIVGSRTTTRLNLRAERLNAAGNVVWEYEASSPAGAVIGRAVTLDADERPIIAGDIGSDWLVLALDGEGKRRWHFTHDGGGGLKNRDQAFAIAFQAPDVVLVAGRIHALPLAPPSLGQVDWRAAAYRLPSTSRSAESPGP